MISKDYEIELRILKLREKRRRKRFFLGLLLWCGAIWVIAYLLFGIALVEGNSMRPTFLPGDLVLYRRSVQTSVDYNDIVILNTGFHGEIIKRIVGKPGDVLEVDEKGHLIRNGKEVREPEILFGNQTAGDGVTFPYTVPDGMYFYLGDNRPVSMDSRLLGAASGEEIRGKVIALFRFGNWGKRTRG